MKQLTVLTEAIQEKMALEFLSKQLKGSKFQGKVYLAGGGVRDELMGIDLKDIDLVVHLPNGGIEFAEWICKKLKIYKKGANPVVYPKFGTAKFNLRGITYKKVDLSNIDIEVVMTRKEEYTAGSRKPKVSVGSLKDDVERRDFTTNSLLKDLTTGEILDLTGMGKADIKRGIIRTPLDPDIIFKEDPLRMLRAIRFATKYNWDLPLFMIKAIKKNAKTIQTISMERIRDELSKMLVTGKPDTAIRLLQITGLSKYIMPELDLLIGLKQNKYHRWDANKHTLMVLKGVPKDLKTRLAALFHDIGKAETKSVVDGAIHFYKHEDVSAQIAADIMRRLKFPNDVIDAVTVAVGSHMRLKQAGVEGEIITDKALRKLKKDLAGHLEMTLDVMHADNLDHVGGTSLAGQIPGVRGRLKKLGKDAPSKPQLPINGQDIMKALKIKPGPMIGKLLAAVEDAWFGNPKITKRQALAIVRKEYKKLK